jgi:hypothetical protein
MPTVELRSMDWVKVLGLVREGIKRRASDRSRSVHYRKDLERIRESVFEQLAKQDPVFSQYNTRKTTGG